MILRIIKMFFVVTVIMSLVAFVFMMDYQEVLGQIRKVGFGFIWVLVSSFLSYLSGSIAWYYCFKNSERISFFKLFFIRTIGENVTLFNPTNIIGGEVSKYIMIESMDLTKNEKWDSILISRILLIFSQLLLVFICVLWMFSKFDYVTEGLLIIVAGVFLIWCAYLIFSQVLSKMIVGMIFRIELLEKCKSKAHDSLNRIFKFGISQMLKVSKAFGFSVLHWLFGSLEIFIILTYLGVTPHFLDCVVVDTGVVLIKSIGAFIPGQIGVEEIGNKWMLALTGVQGASIWISVSIIRRAKQLFWILFSTIFYFIISKIQKSKTEIDGNLIYNT